MKISFENSTIFAKIKKGSGTSMKKIELLAPVGDFDSFYAAINNGANAIYVGGKQFSARAFAPNFTNEELKKLIQEAHQKEVRVYIAVNTLVFENEISTLLEYLDFLYLNDADAFIIQDLGLIDFIAHRYPKVKIHVSTQQNVYSVSQALFLKKMGVHRIILARETPLLVVKEIIKQVGIEVEIFVHGSLCVSYSGTCLHSSIIGKRSGNRGKCAQPCRMEYTLFEDGKPKSEKKYLLSMNDLNTLDKINDLIESGVTSFKIEGRMKSAQYVGAVTKAYADSIHYYLEHKKLLDTKTISQTLKLLFNRSFTKGYLLNEQNDKLTSTYRPNHIGQKVGKVIATYPHKIKIQLIEPLSQKDKIVILQKEDVSFYISKMKVKEKYVPKAFPNEIVELEVHSLIQNQADVYKCLDDQKLKEIELANQQTKKIPITLFFEAFLNQPMKLTIMDHLGHKILVQSEYFPQQSQTAFMNETIIKEQLTKLNNTDYRCQRVECHVEKQLFIPLKELNQLRREAIAKLKEARSIYHHRNISDILLDDTTGDFISKKRNPFLKLAVRVKNLDQLQALQNYPIDFIYYEDEKTFAQAQKINSKVIYSTGRINQKIPAQSKAALIHQVGSIQEKDTHLLIADIYCNITNSYTVDVFLNNGIQHMGLSPELSKDHLYELVQKVKERHHQLPCFEFLVYGRLQNMVMKHCFIAKNYQLKEKQCHLCHVHQYALVDRKNYVFPILTDSNCNVTIFNSKTLHLIDEIDFLYEIGIDVIRLDFSVEEPKVVQEVVQLYWDKIHHNQRNDEIQEATYGHFYENDL